MLSDDDLAKIYVQLSVTFNNLRGVVDRVEFDLRHELLPPGDWRPSFLADFGTSPEPPSDAPYLWFPWFGPYDEGAVGPQGQAAMAGQARARNAKRIEDPQIDDQTVRVSRETSRTSDASIGSHIQANTPECVVQKGDKISIDRVEIVQIGNDFDHIHDLEVRNAYLRIAHANGKIEKTKTPIIFRGRTAVLDRDVGTTFVHEISDRIRRHFNLKSIRDMNLVQKDNSYAYRALRKAYSVDIATEDKSTDVVVVGRRPSEEFHDGSNTWYTVNDAVMMGYLWGRAEADQIMRPTAEKARETHAKNSRAAKLSLAKRGIKTENWHRIAKKIVDEIWAMKPTLPQAEVIRKIDSERWNAASNALSLPGTRLPSAGSLKPFVSEVRRNMLSNGHRD
jgi:hypothetical protein